jgi:hypothetical protein
MLCFVEDPTFGYEDFTRRGTQAPPTFRAQVGLSPVVLARKGESVMELSTISPQDPMCGPSNPKGTHLCPKLRKSCSQGEGDLASQAQSQQYVPFVG